MFNIDFIRKVKMENMVLFKLTLKIVFPNVRLGKYKYDYRRISSDYKRG